MSRVNEALHRAGLRPDPSDEAPVRHWDPLEAFPASLEPEDTPEKATVRHERLAQSPATGRDWQDPPADAGTVAAPGERLVVHDSTPPVSVEQYRRLAAALHHQQAERGTRVVMVASAQAGEGKTLTAANLALTLSESYRRHVLLVDCDLRQPSLGPLLGVTTGSGLSDDLKQSGARGLSVTKLSPFLSLLPGGAPEPDPMASLASDRMANVLQQAAAGFDWVILDTPPVALLSDANVLAAMVEAVVLVIAAGVTPFALVERAIELVGRERIVGVVLNRVEEGDLTDATYGHHYGSAHGLAAGRRRWFFGRHNRDGAENETPAAEAPPAGLGLSRSKP